jgi:hypothetical protein
VALTDGARFYGGTVPSFNSVGGVMSATTTVTLNESELELTFEANCTARTAATAAVVTVVLIGCQ